MYVKSSNNKKKGENSNKELVNVLNFHEVAGRKTFVPVLKFVPGGRDETLIFA